MRLVPLLLLLGCPVVTQTVKDAGTACVSGNEVTVDFDTCLSSSCDTLASSKCTATLSGTVVSVHAEAIYDRQGKECTADCGVLTATCPLPDLTGLTHVTFEYREGSVPIEQASCAAAP